MKKTKKKTRGYTWHILRQSWSTALAILGVQIPLYLTCVYAADHSLLTLQQIKSALSLPVTNMKLPARELLPYVSNFCLTEWQEIWDCCEGNKLHSIYPTVGILKHSKNMSRYDSVLLNRLRIGHSRLTHSYT